MLARKGYVIANLLYKSCVERVTKMHSIIIQLGRLIQLLNKGWKCFRSLKFKAFLVEIDKRLEISLNKF